MKWDRAQAKAHVLALADHYHVTVIWQETPADSIPDRRVVRISEPTTAERYLGCLHEIGHVVSVWAVHFYNRWDRGKPYWRSTSPDDLLLMEAAAWAWAARHVCSELEIPNKAWKAVGNDLASYIKATVDE